ncbi:MAG: YIP1 family protein [Pseudomonadales bacterium]|nr:YIP1 family protein [Pseudomonadales bacterium]
MLKNIIDIIASPQEAFQRLKEKPTILLPLLLILISTASIQVGYFYTVDPDFLVDQLVAQAMQVVSTPEGALRDAYASTSPATLAISSAVSVVIVLTLIMAAYAGYLSLISKFTYDGISFRQWFALVCWTGIPLLFSAVASWVAILSSTDGLISLQQLSPLSLNNLIFQAQGNFANLLNSLNLAQLWSLLLMVLGYAHWRAKKPLSSAVIILLPYVIVYGIWALVIL